MARNRFIKELSTGVVLLLLSFCPVIARENVDVFSQPISSDEPTAPHGMPILPHSVDLPSGRKGDTVGGRAGSAAARNRAERRAELIKQGEEEREQRRARSQEMRRQAEERREKLLKLRSGQPHDGTEYGVRPFGDKDLSVPVKNNAGRDSAQPQSWLDEPGLSKSGPPESALPKTDFVNTSGGSKPRPVAVEKGSFENAQIEEAVPAITQKRAQDLTVPESVDGKVKNGRRGVSQLERAVNRVGKRAASRANSLGSRGVNRALTPIRRAINTPIRF